ncbi:MAG TPA: oligopeptide/dipeptide ABC transporter ATP-binding protein [bacterium]|nr:oligopeptide/dipeptide ABC transporter ATP-binding protein [bacterium]
MTPMLQVIDLVRAYERDGGGQVQAVAKVTFAVQRGETLGLVGESGCGKSSLARAILHIPPPNSGMVILDGVNLTRLSRNTLRRLRRRMQMVFQDPVSSLNPRRHVHEIVAEPLRIWRELTPAQIRERVGQALEWVGFTPGDVWERRPHQFSGGQCQRISLARALVLNPELLICDEPVSALDVSVRAQILNLLHDMQRRFHLTMLFISHDLAAVNNVSDRVAVMYLGKICEIAPTEEVYRRPRHPYTQALTGSLLFPGTPLPERTVVSGELPSPMHPPSGCRFRTRCPRAQDVCARMEPPLQAVSDGHLAACHFPLP